MSLTFAQDINLFVLTVKRPKKQHRQWLLLRAVDRQCGLGGFSSLVGHCVPSFLVPSEKDHQWKWLLTLPALADGHESIFNKPPFGPVLQPLCNVKSLCRNIRWSYILCGMGIRLLNLLQYEVITGLWSEQLCDGNWTGCRVMCFMGRHASHCWQYQPHLSPSPPLICHPSFLFHTTPVTHCTVRRGHVGSQIARAKKSWLLCVHATEWYHKKQWQAFHYMTSPQDLLCFPVG